MDQRDIERFRVIGACTKMQTTSWEDEMKLMDGIPYMIDFFQDFSYLLTDGEPALICDAHVIIQSEGEKADTYPALEEWQRTMELFKQADKIVKQEQKREERWKRKRKRDGRSKKERQRDAEYLFEHIDEWTCSK